MDIATAERALALLVAQQSGLETVCGGGEFPEAPAVARVRFVSVEPAGSTLANGVAEVRGCFAEPGESRAFADAVWGTLPRYGTAGFAELAAEGGVEFSEHRGFFIAAGRVRARFA